MIRETLVEFASQSPEFGQGIDVIEERLSRTAMVPEDLTEAIEMLEAALQNPQMYADMVEAAIADGLINQGDAPAEFDAVFIISILLALYGLQDRGTAQGYARGGLTVAGRRLADQGQGGDSMLAHINPREAEVLRRMGGQGTTNPNTGLVEYKGLKNILKTVLPVALSVFAPGIGTAIGGAMGLSGVAASMVGGAALGAGTSALTGGDWKRGAVLGGVSGGAGSVAGNFVNEGLGLGLTAPVAATLGSGLVGGVAGKMSGSSFGEGALQGAGGQLLKNYAGTSGMSPSFQQAADTTGNMLTSGYSPTESVTSGAVAGLFNAVSPSKAVVAEKRTANTPPPSVGAIPPTSEGFFSGALDKVGDWASENPFEAVGLGISGLSALSMPEDVGTAVSSMSPEQQEYFDRPLVNWDWDAIRADANRANLSLTEFMASNFNDLTSGQYNMQATGMACGGPVPMNQGGALQRASRYVEGNGTGRSDEIPAYLSDGEYVIDAETVALLGDGSNKAGASTLDNMRNNIRSHKGRALSQGQFSPDARSPLEYIKRGVA
tara:strand:+ start:223 stop:1869 length:1647 start_codon:yes stop_codon:yes gene_type:complete